MESEPGHFVGAATPNAVFLPVTDPATCDGFKIFLATRVEDGGSGIRGPVAYEFRAHPVRSVGREFDPAVLGYSDGNH